MSDDQQLERRLAEMLDAKRGGLPEDLPPFVEERVLARLREPMQRQGKVKWWSWLAVGAVTAIAVALAIHTLRVEPPSAIGVVARAGDVTVAPDLTRVATTASARALVNLPRARVSLLQETVAAFSHVTPARVHIDLAQGSLVAEVEPNHPERVFSVALPHAEVVITGTVFYVAVAGGRSQVAVARGHVVVRPSSSTGIESEALSLSAGEVVELDARGVARRPLDAREREAMLASLHVATWRAADVESLGHGLAAARPAVEPAAPLSLAPAVTPGPASRQPPQAPRPDKHEAASVDQAPSPTELLSRRDCAAARAALAARQDKNDETSRAWFGVAVCYNELGELAQALAAYREVVRRFPNAVVSENAAYEIARLSRELRHNEDAEAAFADYIARYPKGALTQEAHFWRCHMAATNGHVDRALTCLRSFRERFPSSARVHETHFSEATLLRTGKRDCQGAIAAYDRYLQSAGEHREQAAQWRQWCEDSIH